jgi:hypothetical protein
MKLYIEYTVPHANPTNVDLMINSCSFILFLWKPEGSVLDVEILPQGDTI